MTVQTRINKINEVASQTREIYRRDASHKAYQLNSLRTGKPYQVITDSKIENDILVIDTFLFSFDHKEQPHPANKSQFICYHVLGTLKYAAKQAGYTLSLCDNYQHAQLVKRFGGRLVLIRNKGNGRVWGVAKRNV